ncbi:MAG: hypothetical protein GQ544_03410, partial [Candidatus Aminicenantes bacterium]|nr:hypothetical protein [Candidatus Aminicenantes bacterium]
SQIYSRLAAYKKHATQVRFASENGIKLELENIKDYFASSSGVSFLSPFEYEQLLQDTQNQGTAMVEHILGSQLPLLYSGGWENLTWNTDTEFYLNRLDQHEHYVKVLYKGEISSVGLMENSQARANSLLETSLQVHAGYLPLPLIPLLIGKYLSAEQKEEFLEIHNISLESTHNTLLPSDLISSSSLIPNTSSALIEKTFKIDIFRPQDLSASRLRQILGLPESEEAVPPGVYLIQDDLGLGGIFVQGDLDHMILAIEEDYQIISFEQGLDRWVLKFDPSQSRTQFITPTTSYVYDLVPLGIIIVDGKIQSLSGGTVDGEGNVLPAIEEEIPCIRRGVNLTILSSEEVVITSHLIYQGVTWQDGVPYLKDSQSQLTIFTTGETLSGEISETSGISIAAEAPTELKLQGSFTTASGRFSLEGSNKRITLHGSLHSPDYASNGNELKILPDERYLLKSDLLQNAPSTKTPMMVITELRVMAWRENPGEF